MTRIEKIEELEDFDLGMNDFVDTTTKLPVVIAVDVSDSMNWHGGIDNAYLAISSFIDAIRSDATASASVEIAIISFNHEVKSIISFSPVKDIPKLDKLKASGTTNIAKAVDDALDYIEERYNYYQANGIRKKSGWFILLTDCDIDGNSIDSVVQRTTTLINNKKLTMFSIGTGNEVNTEQLKRFNPTKPVLFSPDPEELVPLFEFLSQTAIGYSQVGEGESFQSEPLENRRIEFV